MLQSNFDAEKITAKMDEDLKEIHDFKPTGTIAFIILLLAFTALVWFGIYNIQLERHI